MPAAPALAGYRYAMALEDPRAILMALEDIPYRAFNVVIDLEKSAKEGQFSVVVPYDLPRTSHASSASGTEDGHGAMVEIAMDTHTEMDAVLHRVEMTLAEVTALGVGAQIPVPREAVSRMGLEDIFGEKISLGRLGAKAGHRAICINLTDDPGADIGFGAGSQSMGLPAGATTESGIGGSVAGDLPDLDAMVVPAGALDFPGDDETPSGVPDLVDLPDLPPMEGLGTPELPPLDGLPDLSDLPDLADLSLTD